MDIFEWTNLDIKRGPSLFAEAERVARLFLVTKKQCELCKKADSPTFEKARKMIRTSVQQRLELLEKFSMKFSRDERVILFEKHRLKLRRILYEDEVSARARLAKVPTRHSRLANVPKRQSRLTKVPVTSRKIVYSTNLSTANQENIPRNKQDIPTECKRVPPKKNIEKRVKMSITPIKSYQRKQPLLAYSTNKSLKDNFREKMKNAHTEMISRLEPIYKWEMEKEDIVQKPELFESVNFQVRLTPKEFFKFASKRRNAAAFLKHKERNLRKKIVQRQSFYLHSATPFVEQQHIYVLRPDEKEKWQSNNTFFVSKIDDPLPGQ